AGDHFARLLHPAHVGVGGIAVGGVVALVDLAEVHHAAVVHGDRPRRAAVADGGRDLAADRHEVHLGQVDVVLPGVAIALGGALVVVEGHAGGDHVHQGKAAVTNSRLEERHQLILVT